MNLDPADFLIIGTGNVFRSDDGIGISVLKRLRDQLPRKIRSLALTGGGTALLEAWKGARSVIVVDAVQSGAPPGTVYRLDVHAGQMPKRLFRYSTHEFSVAHTIQLARVLNLLPGRLVIYGIEGKTFAHGIRLSREVARAGAAVATDVLNEARSLFSESRV